MKQAILLFISAALSSLAYGQRPAFRSQHVVAPVAARTTTTFGDTTALTNINASDTLTLYTYNNGCFVTGPNSYGDQGFAERYDINGHDSSVSVIGVMSLFGGKVNPASTHSVNFKVWGLSAPVPVTATWGYHYFPGPGLDTVTVPVTHLGIGLTGDTIKSFFFPHATDTIQGAFYIGYDISYNAATLNGDTIGLYSTANGVRNSPLYDVIMNPGFTEGSDTTYDTLVNVQNATLWSDNIWHDNYTQNDSIFNNLAIYPIVVIGHPTGVGSITHNALTFSGNYPNPASDVTNVRFSLKKQANVTITIMDINGKALKTISLNGQKEGAHIVPLTVSELAPGNYIYSLITSAGDAIASKLTVVK